MNSFGQGDDTTDCLEQYIISKSYQYVSLCKSNNSEYEGRIVNSVTKNYRSWGKKKSKIVDEEIVILGSTVAELFSYLKSENIEVLPDSKDISGYPMGLDGTTYLFKIKTSGSLREYSYWEPMNGRYVDGEIPEIQHVRNILNSLEDELELKSSFANFKDGLPKGVYYYGGIEMEVIEKP